MSLNPFKIAGPALISFSGGRTSAFMLHEILRAYDGVLPADVKVAFANTGKEREETLRFVGECACRWAVKVHWLEWSDTKPCFREVGLNSASRLGEPFKALIDKKRRLPNWQERWCTEYLKVRPLHAFAEAQGWVVGKYADVIGFRNDEGHRILKGIENAEKHGRRYLYPLSKAKISKRDVLAFWAASPFDLGLSPGEGNCDVCFMKSRALRMAIMRRNPELGEWWAQEEARIGGFFDRRNRYEAMIAEVAQQPEFDFDASEEHDVECGLLCEPVTPHNLPLSPDNAQDMTRYGSPNAPVTVPDFGFADRRSA